MCTEANEFACLLQGAVPLLKPCLFFGVLSSWGYCSNVWTFKGYAGRLGAAKYLVEGITISAISELPEPQPCLQRCRQGREGGCAHRGCPFGSIRAVGNQRDRLPHVEGIEKLLDLWQALAKLGSRGRKLSASLPKSCDQKDVSASSGGV